MDPAVMDSIVEKLCSTLSPSSASEIKDEPSCSDSKHSPKPLNAPSSIFTLRTNLENKSRQLSCVWSELYELLGEYQSELFSVDHDQVGHSDCGHGDGLMRHRDEVVNKERDDELVELRSQLESLQQHCQDLQEHLEKNRLDNDTKDRLLNQYQRDLIEKDTRITSLEQRLVLFEKAGSSARRATARLPVPSRWSGVHASRTAQARAPHPVSGRVSLARSLLTNRRRVHPPPHQFMRHPPQNSHHQSSTSAPVSIDLDPEPTDHDLSVEVKVENESLEPTPIRLSVTSTPGRSLPGLAGRSLPSQAGRSLTNQLSGYSDQGVDGASMGEELYHGLGGAVMDVDHTGPDVSAGPTADQPTDLSTKIAAAILRSDGHTVDVVSLRKGPRVLRRTGRQVVEQHIDNLVQSGFYTKVGYGLYKKTTPQDLDENDLLRYGVTMESYMEAFDKPLTKMTLRKLTKASYDSVFSYLANNNE